MSTAEQRKNVITVAQYISRITDADDLALIRAAYKDAIRKAAIAAANKFNVGDRVTFYSKRHGLVRGTITGFLTKNITLKSDTGVRWRVHPTFLKKE